MNIIDLMLWKAIKPFSPNKVQSKEKWRSHPSTLALVSEHKSMAKTFHFISKEDIFKEIKILYNSKAIEESDIPVKKI